MGAAENETRVCFTWGREREGQEKGETSEDVKIKQGKYHEKAWVWNEPSHTEF